jgi:hypothetical protein
MARPLSNDGRFKDEPLFMEEPMMAGSPANLGQLIIVAARLAAAIDQHQSLLQMSSRQRGFTGGAGNEPFTDEMLPPAGSRDTRFILPLAEGGPE